MPTGYIYKLESSFEDPGLYIGSTIDWNRRKAQHKYRCNTADGYGYNLKLYQYIREYGGFKNWFMIIVEEYEYTNKTQLNEREDYWIKELDANLNLNDAIKNEEKTRKIKNEYNRNRYYENKDKIKAYQSKKFNCDCGGTYTTNGKARHFKTKKHQRNK
tara:strand:+ start:91 stop:567 length:477 start_codon:yes stop_codon:yes gene_type:complete